MNATIGGYLVTLIDSKKAIWIEVEHGVRGFGIPVTVTETDGEYSVSMSGNYLKVLSVTKVDRPKI